ncbi:TVP38/TMEM64 family protein [Candidatus Nitrospira allomarina]|uniref:TVP38/TMEM64 family membrane protein n=1 Tax=Candidatus Nitrospira allomarina TaxID=3020900 RepID=A0AA96G9T6_9BACT|nr:VTT domain-containing protein [Candidatus Nitrospira allomarina]WNM57082.1 VTT domain-containing protein [Candidatus Nitrospira allomarina]
MTFSLITDSKKKLLYIIAFFLLLYVIVTLTGLRSHLSPDVIQSLFFAYPVWGLVLFCLAFSFGNLLYVPGWIFLVGAVFALGKEWGGVATLLAAMRSSTISFLLIRAVGGTALRSFNHRWADRVFAHLDERPILSVAFLRLLFQTLPALNYALALADIRFRDYLVGTAVGLPLPIFLYCYFFELIFQHLLNR